MKRTIGGILLAFVFALLIGVTCVAFGWKTGLIMWTVSFAVTLIILVAIFLIQEGE